MKSKLTCCYVRKCRRGTLQKRLLSTFGPRALEVYEQCTHPAKMRKFGGVVLPACQCHVKGLRKRIHGKRLKKVKGPLFR